MTNDPLTPPCRICGNRANNQTHVALEMMFGLRDAFEYVECGDCGCLQIAAIPNSMSRYYPPNYYSFKPVRTGGLKEFLRRRRAEYAMGRRTLLGRILAARFGAPEFVEWVQRAGIHVDDAVLDVGCGTGQLLLAMQLAGFTNLTGVDPYIPGEIAYPGGVRVLRRSLSEMSGAFRFVLFNHSFEHISDPAEALRETRRILDPGGTVLIRIPVAACHAWRHYRTNWVQLDAPRHFFLHTERSIRVLAKQAGFDLFDARWDSTEFQFWGSEQYALGIPLHDSRSYYIRRKSSIFSKRQIASFRIEAKRLNEKRDGDAAAFYLRPSSPADGVGARPGPGATHAPRDP